MDRCDLSRWPAGLRLVLCALVGAAAGCGDGPFEPGGDGSPSFEVVDLGSLGGENSRAQDINDSGEIVGYAQNARSRTRAFLWRDGVMTDLGTLGGAWSNAVALNRRGEVVGRSDTPGGWSHAALWRDGEVIDLGTLPGHDESWATSVDDRGRVVGGGYRLLPTEEPAHAVLWRDGEPTDLGEGMSLGKPAGDGIFAGCLKDRFSCTRAILWRDGAITDLDIPTDPVLPGASAAAHDANRSGMVLVRVSTGRSYLWEDGVARELRYPGAAYTQAEGVNDDGLVAGHAEVDGMTRAFLWDDGEWIDLGAAAEVAFGPGEAVRTLALALNSRGQVVGARVTADGRFRAVLWDPR